MTWSRVLIRRAQSTSITQLLISGLEPVGRHVWRQRRHSDVLLQNIQRRGAGAQSELTLEPCLPWAEACIAFPWQQLKMAMRLAGTGPWTTVEKPQSGGVLIDAMHR